MPEVTENYVRLPVNARSKGDTLRTITISEDRGIKALYNTTKKNIATYLFSTKKWTMATARKWVQEHQHTTKMINTIGEELNKLGLEISYRKGVVSITKAIHDKEAEDKITEELADRTRRSTTNPAVGKVIASRDMVGSYDVVEDVPPRQAGPKAPKKELDSSVKKAEDPDQEVPDVPEHQTAGKDKDQLWKETIAARDKVIEALKELKNAKGLFETKKAEKKVKEAKALHMHLAAAWGNKSEEADAKEEEKEAKQAELDAKAAEVKAKAKPAPVKKSEDAETEVSDKQTRGTKKPTLKTPPTVEPGLWEMGARKFLEFLDEELEKLQAGGPNPGGEGSQGAGTFGTDVGYKKKTPKEAKEASKTGEKHEEEETTKGGPGSGRHKSTPQLKDEYPITGNFRHVENVGRGISILQHQQGHYELSDSHASYFGRGLTNYKMKTLEEARVEGKGLAEEYRRKSEDPTDLTKGGVGSGKYAAGENSHGFGLVKRLHKIHQTAIEAHRQLSREIPMMDKNDPTYAEKQRCHAELGDRISKIRNKLRNVEIKYPQNLG